jgi:hypothetical protein
MMVLRPEQRATVDKVKAVLKRYNLVYLAAQPRCGKTLMSISTAHEMGFRRILFLTKKKAISSIEADLKNSGLRFHRFIILNYEQMLTKNIPSTEDFDLIICDESTVLSAFPKPGAITKAVKKLVSKLPLILMSGTPSPESLSQLYHQFHVSYYSPFVEVNFYKWAKEFVDVKQVWRNGYMVNDYKKAKTKEIEEITKHYMVTLSQKEAGFTAVVEEKIIYVDVDDRLYRLMDVLKKNKVYEMKSGDTIVADTGARMQQLCHQISSGTVITGEEKERRTHILDTSKVKAIKNEFRGRKIAIYYLFIAEGEMLRREFPNHTDDPMEFNRRSDLVFICQFASGSMGVNLSTADDIVMYNIHFSATIYYQVRERTQARDRTKNSTLWWIFSKKGIEKHVYNAVVKKKDFTEKYFRENVLDLIGK